MEQDDDVTGMLIAWKSGDDAALERLSPLVYDELRRLAGRRLSQERAGHTLQTSALVHEAFIRLIDADLQLESRQHFFALAARMMRRVLVDHARSRLRVKRGSGAQHETLNTSVIVDGDASADILELDDALGKLAAKDPGLAEAVELIYFGGLSYDEAAVELGVSRTSLVEELKFAKAWLRKAMA